MKHCLLRRLLGLVPLLLGISFLSFVLIQLSPGDPAEVAIRVNDQTPTPELLAEVRTQPTVEYRSRRLFDGENMPRKRLEGRSSEKGDRLAYTVTDASRAGYMVLAVYAAPVQG